jgi:nucleoside-triphosphatase THEP1
MFDAECNLAAVVYGTKDDPDSLLLEFARDLGREGFRVVGVVQRRRAQRGVDAALDVVVLPTGRIVALDHERGPSACRLDSGRLAGIAHAVAVDIAAGADLLIVNRFGRMESRGQGLVGLIRQAVAADIPVLTAVPEAHFASCVKYSDGMNIRVPCRRASLDQWWKSVTPRAVGRTATATFCEIAK